MGLAHHKNSLLEQENQGLRESLGIKKKRQKHGRTMDLVQEGEHNGGAVLWSPRKFREAGERQLQREQAEEQEKLHKADMKKLKANNALYKKKIAEEKRVAKEMAKEEREKEKEKRAQEQAQKKQQKEEEKQAAEAREITQPSQITQATTSKKQAPKRKRVERCTGGASGVNSEEAPPKVTRTGRNITIPKKFR
ncbi:hypothetical protein EJ02DRAFT_487834 [Clathrospora elynae]|uniref:Uncharacterized protein n=2 Tax=Clathrospora elynae TaxID=706981 RepID=A0A6A5S4T4_9PLEO|nr:hypothetical protein EJ02DRAFT_487834 [Clathrospora elynae]